MLKNRIINRVGTRKMSVKTFDKKCYELATEFLLDEPPDMNTADDKRELAKSIQDAIEIWIIERRQMR